MRLIFILITWLVILAIVVVTQYPRPRWKYVNHTKNRTLVFTFKEYAESCYKNAKSYGDNAELIEIKYFLRYLWRI